MEFRGLFSKLFAKTSKPNNAGTVTVEYSNAGSSFAEWHGDLYESDIVRAAIWTNAKNAGKLHPKHIRQGAGKYETFPNPKIRRLLARPNQYMSMSVFLNKLVIQCQKKNNAFALIKFGADGWPEGLFPITYNRVEAIESAGFYFIRFYLAEGKQLVVPYEELIHIRTHFDSGDLFGADNHRPLAPIMEVINTTDKGLVAAIKRSAVIRWILKFTQVLNPKDRKQQIDEFVTNYLSAENSGGAVPTDPRYDAVQVKPESYVPNAAQMDRATARIYSYFGVSENIIQGKFSEDEWNAYYENTIEPFAIQLSEEFTEKLFTQKERDFGNEIIFEANRLQYASNSTKIAVGRFLTDIGGATLDQVLEIFNMAPIGGEEGARRVQTLNMVNAEKADEYQLGTKAKGAKNSGTNNGTDADATKEGSAV